jgi:hypothetical protein
VNNTCGGERLSNYPQQVLEGNLWSWKTFRPPQHSVKWTFKEGCRRRKIPPEATPVEVKDFQIIHSKSCREPVELKDPSGLRIPMKSPGHSEMMSPGIPT